MFVAYSFIGKLPEYIIDTIYQTRLFFDDKIFLITDDIESQHLDVLKNYDVIIVNYMNVYSEKFLHCYENNKNKFVVLYGLKERNLLFIRVFERLFLLQNLMGKYNVNDGFFMELDNLIYDNPKNWLKEFSKYELCYMFDNYNRCSSGVMYVKNADSLNGLLDFTLKYIDNYQSTEWMNEMALLYDYYKNVENENKVQIIPTHWDNNQYDIPAMNYNKYNETIFDAAAIGIYLFGNDPNAVPGPTISGIKNKFSLIDYTKYQFCWMDDKKQRKIPHIFDGVNWIKINNLHIYTKDLKKALSIQL